MYIPNIHRETDENREKPQSLGCTAGDPDEIEPGTSRIQVYNFTTTPICVPTRSSQEGRFACVDKKVMYFIFL